jgi:nicotinate-nucleotide adenylyltransferase
MSFKRRSIGLFGGTFDPIHFGHLNLAISIFEARQLDSIIFCPAHISPLKKEQQPHVSKEARLEMLALAIQPLQGFTLLDWEIRRPAPSFTIDTVRFLLSQEQYRETQLHLILGEDALFSFHEWKEASELARLAPPLVGMRPGKISGSFPSFFEKENFISTPVMEISSTEIRKRLNQNKYCGHLIPAKVLDYIYINKLYAN